MTAITPAPRRVHLVGLAVLAAGLVATLALLLPPSRVRLAPLPRDAREIAGALHVHTTRSDGTGTVDEIAAAASRAGLQFVVLSDHGDATRPPDPPRYLSGVLCLDGVEIGTTAGHYLAIGLTRASPYPLGGEPRDVVEDVARLGGFGIAAHPESPRQQLRWRDWSAPVDAIEWLNADSEWRDATSGAVARAMVTYFIRPPEVIASLFDQPSVLARLDSLSRRRRVIALAGHDAHARIGFEGDPAPANAASLRVPSYTTVFRAFTQRVLLAEPPTGVAHDDAARVLAALRAGHTYTVVNAFASPGRLTFEADSPEGRATGGDELVAKGGVRMTARAPHAPGVVLVLLRNGEVVTSQSGPTLSYAHAPAAGTTVYRVEARLDADGRAHSVPWMVSNPIWINPVREPLRLVVPPAAAERRLFTGHEPDRWTLEKDAESVASAEVGYGPWGSQVLQLTYDLAGGMPRGQYAAAVTPLDPQEFPAWDRVRFRAGASPQTRISVQVRDDRTGRRWKRSVVVGGEPREIVVRLDDMSFAEPRLGGRPPRGGLGSLLFVIDTTHTRPGTSGRVWIDDVQIEVEKWRSGKVSREVEK